MIRAVLDTNVYISSLFWRGAPYLIVQEGLRGFFMMLTSEAILEEVEHTLQRKFQFPLEDTRTFIEIIALNAHIIEPNFRVSIVIADPTDNKIVECAIAGQADFIISGDKHILTLKKYKGIEMLSPASFLDILKS